MALTNRPIVDGAAARVVSAEENLGHMLRRVLPTCTGLLVGTTASLSAAASIAAPPGAGPASLAGSTVVVFGGSSGIGKAVAMGAAKQGASNVHIIGRDEGKLAAAKLEIEASSPATSCCTVRTMALNVMDEPAVRSYLKGAFIPQG